MPAKSNAMTLTPAGTPITTVDTKLTLEGSVEDREMVLNFSQQILTKNPSMRPTIELLAPVSANLKPAGTTPTPTIPPQPSRPDLNPSKPKDKLSKLSAPEVQEEDLKSGLAYQMTRNERKAFLNWIFAPKPGRPGGLPGPTLYTSLRRAGSIFNITCSPYKS